MYRIGLDMLLRSRHLRFSYSPCFLVRETGTVIRGAAPAQHAGPAMTIPELGKRFFGDGDVLDIHSCS